MENLDILDKSRADAIDFLVSLGLEREKKRGVPNAVDAIENNERFINMSETGKQKVKDILDWLQVCGYTHEQQMKMLQNIAIWDAEISTLSKKRDYWLKRYDYNNEIVCKLTSGEGKFLRGGIEGFDDKWANWGENKHKYSDNQIQKIYENCPALITSENFTLNDKIRLIDLFENKYQMNGLRDEIALNHSFVLIQGGDTIFALLNFYITETNEFNKPISEIDFTKLLNARDTRNKYKKSYKDLIGDKDFIEYWKEIFPAPNFKKTKRNMKVRSEDRVARVIRCFCKDEGLEKFEAEQIINQNPDVLKYDEERLNEYRKLFVAFKKSGMSELIGFFTRSTSKVKPAIAYWRFVYLSKLRNNANISNFSYVFVSERKFMKRFDKSDEDLLGQSKGTIYEPIKLSATQDEIEQYCIDFYTKVFKQNFPSCEDDNEIRNYAQQLYNEHGNIFSTRGSDENTVSSAFAAFSQNGFSIEQTFGHFMCDSESLKNRNNFASFRLTILDELQKETGIENLKKDYVMNNKQLDDINLNAYYRLKHLQKYAPDKIFISNLIKTRCFKRVADKNITNEYLYDNYSHLLPRTLSEGVRMILCKKIKPSILTSMTNENLEPFII